MKKPYELPEKNRLRLTRTEMHSMQWLMNAISSFGYASDDLATRLEWVPSGRARLRMINGQCLSLLRDLAGTIPEKQRNSLVNVGKDMEMRLVPKMTPPTVTVTLTKEDGKELVDAAQVKCKQCAEWNEESEKCRLRKLLEVVVPLEDYSGMICPYSKAEWEDEKRDNT